MNNEVYKIGLSIVGTLIPTVIIFVYLLKNFKFARYKYRWILYLVICGVFTAGTAPYLTDWLDSFWKAFLKSAHIYNKTTYNFVYATFCVGVSEELFKCSFAAMAAIIVLDMDSRYDALFCGAVTALGFAITENMSYIYKYGISTAVTRSVTAVPLHVMLGIIFGYYLAKMGFYYYKGFQYKGYRRKFFVEYFHGLAWGILVHGLYDFFLFQKAAEMEMLNKILVIMVYVAVIRLVYRVSKTDKKYIKVNDDIPVTSDDESAEEPQIEESVTEEIQN